MPRSLENKNAAAKVEYVRKRQGMIEYLGGVCVVCGGTEGLEIDHIDRTKKAFSLAKMWSYPWTTLMPELDKCQLLCSWHHQEKTSREMGVPHGGGAEGKHGCKCDPCRMKKNEYLRNLKRRKRAERAATPL